MFHSSPPVGALRARASKPAYLPQGFRQAFLATGRACSLALAAPLPLFAGARGAPPAFLSPSQRSSPPAFLWRSQRPSRFSLPLAALKPSRRGAASESEQARSSTPGVPPGVFGNRAGLLAGARSAPTTFRWRSRLPSRFSLALAAPLPLFSLHRGSPPAFLSPSRLPSRFSYALHSFS